MKKVGLFSDQMNGKLFPNKEKNNVSNNILVFYCCCSKLPQTQWLKTSTNVLSYSFGDQESKRGPLGQNQSVCSSAFLSDGSKENPAFALFFFERLPSFLGLGVPFCLQSQHWLVESFSHPITLTLTLLPPHPHFKTLVITLGPYR